MQIFSLYKFAVLKAGIICIGLEYWNISEMSVKSIHKIFWIKHE